jgi:hypothetical protein
MSKKKTKVKKRRKRETVVEESLVTADNLLITQPPKEAAKAREELKMSEGEMRTRLERELRRYIKRRGGLRKGLENDKKAKAIVAKLMKALGREKMEWDQEIHVPGYDNPTVRDLVGVI